VEVVAWQRPSTLVNRKEGRRWVERCAGESIRRDLILSRTSCPRVTPLGEAHLEPIGFLTRSQGKLVATPDGRHPAALGRDDVPHKDRQERASADQLEAT
jgi:hypothetical protein